MGRVEAGVAERSAMFSRMPPVDWLLLSGCAWLAWSAYWVLAARGVNRSRSSEGWVMRMQHLLPLVLGFALIFHGGGRSLVYGRICRGTAPQVVGLALTLAGLAFAVWARVHLGRYWSGIITIKEDRQLIRTGPYRYVRHPVYAGFLLAVLGSAVTAGTGDAAAGFILILVAYLVKLRREEAVLCREFGEQYRHFRNDVAALCPLIY